MGDASSTPHHPSLPFANTDALCTVSAAKCTANTSTLSSFPSVPNETFNRGDEGWERKRRGRENVMGCR